MSPSCTYATRRPSGDSLLSIRASGSFSQIVVCVGASGDDTSNVSSLPALGTTSVSKLKRHRRCDGVTQKLLCCQLYKLFLIAEGCDSTSKHTLRGVNTNKQ